MNTHVINHNALTYLVEAGAISSVMASAKGDIWTLTVVSADIEKVVMAKNSGKPRVWRKLDTLAKYLQTLGINKFEIDVSNYNAQKKSLRRPDSAESLRRAHQSYKSQKQNIIESPKPKLAKGESIQSAKERWEERRARILAEENPRVK